MSRKKSVVYGGVAVCLVLLLSFIYVIPVRSTSGFIDTTTDQCFLASQKPMIQRYHILFGQYSDYKIVKKHLIASTPGDCGQRAQFRLFL